MSAAIFDRFLTTAAMEAVFADHALVAAMLRFEAALAQAQAEQGLIPASAAAAIAASCRVELIDIEGLVRDGRTAGTLAVPLVKQLKERVGSDAPHLHLGATSQDVIDSAMAQVSRAGVTLLDDTLARLTGHLLDLAGRHLDTPLAARTLMQPAQPTTFGLKVLGWAAPIVRARSRLRDAAGRALRVQLGGAVGTLSAMGEHGAAVRASLAQQLGLADAPAWHTQRDDWLRLGMELAVLCGSLGKIGRDLALMSQAEVAELAEPRASGRGASSAMPHKQNPVAAMTALAAATRAPQRAAALLAAMDQEHERGLGGWQAELAEWPALFLSAHGAAAALEEAMAGLTVDAARMRANLAVLGDDCDVSHAAALARQQLDQLRKDAA